MIKNKLEILIRANQARFERQFRDAIKLYTEYLSEHDNVDVMHVLAFTFLQLSIENPEIDIQEDNAIEWIDKAIVKAPQRADFYVTRGDIYSIGIDFPNYQEAAKSYRKALELNPNLADAYLGLASLEGVPDQVVSLSEAIRSVEKASQLQPRKPEVFLRLGSLYHQAGEERNAWIAYESALLKPQTLETQNVVEITQRLH